MGGSVQEGELGRHRGRLRLARLSLVGLALFGGALEAGELRDVRVCADPANLPFSSKDPAVPGFEVELARALAPDTTFHWVPTYRWVFIARQLLDRRCNVFFGLPADPRFEGENRSIALSRPYYVMGQVLVSRAGEGIRGLGDLKDKVVGVQAATPGDLLVVERGYQRRTYLTPEETFEAVRTRHVDAAVMWSPPAGWLAKKASGIELTWIRDPEGEFKIAVGMRKEDRGLKSAVDQTIERLVEEKTVEAILGRYGVPILGSP
jgi:polar amino acid transport system substrate-binding protein